MSPDDGLASLPPLSVDTINLGAARLANGELAVGPIRRIGPTKEAVTDPETGQSVEVLVYMVEQRRLGVVHGQWFHANPDATLMPLYVELLWTAAERALVGHMQYRASKEN